MSRSNARIRFFHVVHYELLEVAIEPMLIAICVQRQRGPGGHEPRCHIQPTTSISAKRLDASMSSPVPCPGTTRVTTP